jgi:hypothetical protein
MMSYEEFVRKNELRAAEVIGYIKENMAEDMKWPEMIVFTATLAGALLAAAADSAEAMGEDRKMVISSFLELLNDYTQKFSTELAEYWRRKKFEP